MTRQHSNLSLVPTVARPSRDDAPFGRYHFHEAARVDPVGDAHTVRRILARLIALRLSQAIAATERTTR